MTDATFDEDEEFDPEEAERQIGEFITAADRLEGPSTAELAAGVERVLSGAWTQIEDLIGAQPNNKIVAIMLLLSRQARELTPEEPRQWQLYAGSSLVSAMIPNAKHP